MFSSPSLTVNSSTQEQRKRTHLQVETLEDRTVPSAIPVLQDNFDTNTLNLDTWVSGLTDTDGNPIAVRAQNQRLEFTGPGALITQEEFTPSDDAPLVVSGLWTWTPTGGLVGTAQVVTRASGSSVIEDGVEFRADPGVGLSIWLWQDRQTRLLTLAPMKIDVGDSFRFRVRDDGEQVTFSMAEIGGDGAALSLAAATDAGADVNHVAFRYGGVVFAPVARLGLDDVSISSADPGTEIPSPVPMPLPGPTTPPVPRPGTLVPAIEIAFLGDDGPDDDPSTTGSSRRDMSRQVRVRSSRLRRVAGGRLRQTLMLQNLSNQAVVDLKLAFSRLPRRARVRIAGGDWMTAAQAARGIPLDDDMLNPGESITIEIELTHAGHPGRGHFRTQVLGNLDTPDEGTDGSGFDGGMSGAASSAATFLNPDDY